jgi:hypothetical protein
VIQHLNASLVILAMEPAWSYAPGVGFMNDYDMGEVSPSTSPATGLSICDQAISQFIEDDKSDLRVIDPLGKGCSGTENGWCSLVPEGKRGFLS